MIPVIFMILTFPVSNKFFALSIDGNKSVNTNEIYIKCDFGSKRLSLVHNCEIA